MFKVGAKVIFIGTAPGSDTSQRLIMAGNVTAVNNRDQLVFLDNKHKPEDCMYAAFCWPDIPDCHTFLAAQLGLVQRHKEELEEFQVKLYKFNNELVRAGLK